VALTLALRGEHELPFNGSFLTDAARPPLPGAHELGQVPVLIYSAVDLKSIADAVGGATCLTMGSHHFVTLGVTYKSYAL